MSKKVVSILLIVIFILTTPFGNSYAAQKKSLTSYEIERIITKLEIMERDKNDSMNLSNLVTRAQFAQMLVNASGNKDTVGKARTSLYQDVPKDYWASGYIQKVVTEGWMNAYLVGAFKPEQPVTLQEAMNGVLRLLGYTKEDFSGNLILAQEKLYQLKKLDKNITKTRKEELTREDCMNLFYNLLKAETKDTTMYGTLFHCVLNEDDEIDYTKLSKEEIEGPLLVSENWKREVPLNLIRTTYYRNDKLCNMEDIKVYDIVYYSEDLEIMWAYSKKETGIVEAILPNTINPTQVTVSGKTYDLGTDEIKEQFSEKGNIILGNRVTLLFGKEDKVDELFLEGPFLVQNNWQQTIPFDLSNVTYYRNDKKCKSIDINLYDILYYSEIKNAVWAYSKKVTGTIDSILPNIANPEQVVIKEETYNLGNDKVKDSFSDLGELRKGDRITLLFGKEDTVVDLLDANLFNSTLYGVVLEKGSKVGVYNNKATVDTYIRIVDTTGKEQEIVCDTTEINKGNAVQVSYIEDKTIVTIVNRRIFNDSIEYDGVQFGDFTFAQDSRIIDLNGDSYITIHPDRLKGVKLFSANIIYYALNAKNEITDMILNNATGDLSSYGILMEASENESEIDNPFSPTGKQTIYSGSYKCNIDGTEKMFTTSSKIFYLTESRGVCKFNINFKTNELENITFLQSIPVVGVSAQEILGYGSKTYTMSDKAVTYLYKKGTYYKTEFSKVVDLNKYSLTAYYDQLDTIGGRVRVIVAELKETTQTQK